MPVVNIPEMTQKEKLYEYLKSQFPEGEPILLSELTVPEMHMESVRKQMHRLTTDGLLCRFDKGIYFLPRESPYRFRPVIPQDSVIRKKFLYDDSVPCGYFSGPTFANLIGVTTQVPMVCEIRTNKATSDRRVIRLAGLRFVVRKPYVSVNRWNIKELQFLDLLADIMDLSELEGKALTERLKGYMQKSGLCFSRLERYLPHYPDVIYKNMYAVGLINGITIHSTHKQSDAPFQEPIHHWKEPPRERSTSHVPQPGFFQSVQNYRGTP